MLYKIDPKLVFENKRKTALVTPCCNKSNKDGKFVNYKNLPLNFGYCHSCGNATLPPALYKNEKGEEYVWNNELEKFEPLVIQNVTQNVLQVYYKGKQCVQKDLKDNKNNIKYISKHLLSAYYNNKPVNNLTAYLIATYGSEKAQGVLQMYYIGTNKDGGCVFWSINSQGKVQKAKVSYYNVDGKRTAYFKVPYKNEEGYYSCLFGEHLIDLPKNKNKTIILVESEKTAIVCSMHLPEYVWLAYGGINGLTKAKLKPLIGRKIILVPDISENAVSIMNTKKQQLKELGIDAKVWDMTNSKSDEQLKKEGWYNCDLEDIFRTFQKKL